MSGAANLFGTAAGGVVDSSITSHMLDHMLIPDKSPEA